MAAVHKIGQEGSKSNSMVEGFILKTRIFRMVRSHAEDFVFEIP